MLHKKHLTPLGFFAFCVLSINKQKAKIKNINFLQKHPMNLSTNSGSYWPSGFREKD